MIWQYLVRGSVLLLLVYKKTTWSVLLPVTSSQLVETSYAAYLFEIYDGKIMSKSQDLSQLQYIFWYIDIPRWYSGLYLGIYLGWIMFSFIGGGNRISLGHICEYICSYILGYIPLISVDYALISLISPVINLLILL